MVNEEKIALFQDVGEHTWWDLKNLPSNVAIIKNIENIKEDSYKGGLIITDKIINDNAILAKSVIYRPKTLVIGIGIHWDTTKEEILNGIKSIFSKNDLRLASIKSLTSIKKKIPVKGLDEFSKEFNIPLYLFEKEELERISGSNPSDTVRKFEGVASVSEASSILLSQGTLLIPKQKFPPNLTISVCRVNY